MAGALKPKILVTRPQPGADQTASRLLTRGFEPLVLPFTEMSPLAHQLDDAVVHNATAVVVTSANALRIADLPLLQRLQHLPVYSVGDATKDAALERGLTNVVSADGDARDLIALISQKLEPAASIIYLCGQTRSDDIEKELTMLGYLVPVIETYQTNKVSQLTYKMSELIYAHKLAGALLYSSISARIFDELWSSDLGTNLFDMFQ